MRFQDNRLILVNTAGRHFPAYPEGGLSRRAGDLSFGLFQTKCLAMEQDVLSGLYLAASIYNPCYPGIWEYTHLKG